MDAHLRTYGSLTDLQQEYVRRLQWSKEDIARHNNRWRANGRTTPWIIYLQECLLENMRHERDVLSAALTEEELQLVVELGWDLETVINTHRAVARLSNASSFLQYLREAVVEKIFEQNASWKGACFDEIVAYVMAHCHHDDSTKTDTRRTPWMNALVLRMKEWNMLVCVENDQHAYK